MRWVTAKPRQGPGPRRLRLRPCPQARRTACAGPKWDRVADPFVTYQPRPWVRSSEGRSSLPPPPAAGVQGAAGKAEPRNRAEPGQTGPSPQMPGRHGQSQAGGGVRDRRGRGSRGLFQDGILGREGGGSGARRGRRAGRGSRGRAGAAPGCRYHIPPQSGARGMAPPPRALPLCPFLPDLPSLPRVLQATEAKVSA